MELTDEAITEFAEHLIPEAFTTSTSASRVEIRPPARVEWAGEWLTSCLRDAVAARDLAGDGIPGVIYVQREDERWRWDLPHAVWPLEVLADKVRRQLADFPEPCVFVASLLDRDRQRLRSTMSARPEMPWSMPWYAEERSRSRAQVMSGVLTVHGSSPGRSTAIPHWMPFEKAARRVLVGHPSRRRYRLR